MQLKKCTKAATESTIELYVTYGDVSITSHTNSVAHNPKIQPRESFYIRRSGGLAPKFASDILVGGPNFASKIKVTITPNFAL